MATTLTPMIHVSDVPATIAWYRSIGFTLSRTYEDEGEINFAILKFGAGVVMFNAGGKASKAQRRDVDLYIETENVDLLFERVRDKAEIVEGPHATFYGMREFILRDCNGFWITFGEPAEPSK